MNPFPPELTDYVGSKGGSGQYQAILSRFAKAETYLVPFIGSGQIYRRLPEDSWVFSSDIDENVVRAWNNGKLTDEPVELSHWFTFLENHKEWWVGFNSVSVYCDPPYHFDTRTHKGGYYAHEWNHGHHERFLLYIKNYPAQVMISHPINELYSSILQQWHCHEYTYQCRRGTRNDAIWTNYDPATVELATYEHIGSDYTDRQRIKRKRSNIVRKLNELPFHERMAVLEQLNQEH
jgi:site-specific DNA-adenine methylase